MRPRTGFWWKCRTVFRHFRRLMIVLVLVLIGVLVWLNRIGLPDFVKRPLVETLRERGVELEFSRLRLSLRRGLVADDVHLGWAQGNESPALSVRQVQLRLDYRALLHRRLQVNGLALHRGRLVWTLSPTNTLKLDQIQSDLRFQTNDTWSLDNFRADFVGMKITLSGDIAHARSLRDWGFFEKPVTNAVARQIHLKTFADSLHEVHFVGTPQLNLVLNGDAQDLRSFKIHFLATVPAVKTPWGSATNVQLIARMTAPGGKPANPASSRDWTSCLRLYHVEGSIRVADLESQKLKAQLISCAGFWRPPELCVTDLFAELGGGRLQAGARLNVDTREFSFASSSCFDPHAIAELLTDKTQDWLAQFSWTHPPALKAEGSLTLPAWPNHQPDWREKVQPTVRLAGSFAVTNSAFRGVAVDSAHGHFYYSNLVWRLSRFVVERPEGTLELADVEDDRTKDFRWHVQGALAPEAIQPLLAANQAEEALKPFTFTQPLYLNADVWGRLDDDGSLGAAGGAALTNFTVHGEAVSSVESKFHYTNRFLEFLNPRLQAGSQKMAADGITVDFNSWRIYFTNGFSTADPRAVARAIGPQPGAIMEPYRFGLPCPARVNGYAPLRGVDDADLWFESDGVPFDWLKLKTPRIAGKVHWMGQTLVLTNLTGEFYGGSAEGFANFDFRPKKGMDFGFTANVQNADVHKLSIDLSSPTNHLEGLLSGRFVMTSANSDDWHTWNGYGQAHLHDGLIWDVPIFGMLSPVLNAITPGLGSSRATDATAQFGMTNGVIFSDDLEIRTMMMRLQYAGTVNLLSHVDAHVTAQLLRDTWVVGPLLSTALWPVSKLFEYKVSGTLQQPHIEPVYIPRVLLMPLHPFRSLEDVLNNLNTNAVPPK